MKIIITTKKPVKVSKVSDVAVPTCCEEIDIEKMPLSQVVDLMADLNERAIDALRLGAEDEKVVCEGRKVKALWKHFFKDVPPNEEIREIAKKMLIHVERAEEYCADYEWRCICEEE